MGMAAIGTALWSYVMKYSPHDPAWFNRDRFVLSNGHCCLFQYTFLHLTGYKTMSWDMLKSYHSVLPDSLCPGHPEVEIDGVEVTTGPLGQGIANAVGLAMARQHLAETYNRPGHDVVDNTTFCMIGDACLQEGVALEAISLAGHWKLRNLIVMYDNNQITCDGTVDITNNEDINAKMLACGWDVIDIPDGNYDVTGIVDALEQARNKTEDKPTFINIRTVIGVGSQIQGQAGAHGAAFGPEDVKHIKKTFGMNPEEHFIVPPIVRSFFEHKPSEGKQLVADWNKRLDAYRAAHPELAAEFTKRMNGELTGNPLDYIPKKADFKDAPFPGRKSAGLVCNPLAQHINTFMVGTADLTPSVAMTWPGKVDFQHPDLRTGCGINGDYTGRYIHWGIREHAMASISNGLSAYAPGTILPVTSSFFMFYIYAAPGVRMGALQRFQQIHIATHDSIGTGEDGPTHQPIELAALMRAMPNFLYIRPADSEEAAGAFLLALSAKHTPSMLSVSRQNNPQYPQYSSRDGVTKGGYVFIEDDAAAVTLVGAGAELKFAVDAAKELKEKHGVKARVVSMPCLRQFEAQPAAYKRDVLRRARGPAIAVEAFALGEWARYADAGYGMATFGHSLPGAVAYEHFGFSGTNIASKVVAYLKRVEIAGGITEMRAEGFVELNEENYRKNLAM